MIEIREPNFSLDLPGEWQPEPGPEPSSAVFSRVDGPGKITVLLLGVRPLFAIADQEQLLQDYLKHRSTFESGVSERVITSDFVSSPVGENFEGAWLGLDVETNRRIRHRVILTNGLLVDFAYEDTGDVLGFQSRADEVLGSAQAFYDAQLAAPDEPEADDDGDEQDEE